MSSQDASPPEASLPDPTPLELFLGAVEAGHLEAAEDVLRSAPRIATESLHVAATLGRVDDVKRLIGEDPSRVSSRAGGFTGEPLLYLCYSPFHGQSASRDAGLLEAAGALLDAGADPNTTDARYHVPALYAVTGARSVLPLARLLLEAGANPTDGESVFHAAENFHEEALELLLASGADLNFVGDWGNTALYFLLRWHDVEGEVRVRQGVIWLLEHGADPDVRSGTEQESALHVAVRRGQGASVIALLLDHGADVHARRDDGATPWLLARRGGFDALAAMLETAGAQTQPLSPLDELLAACGRGDVDAARRLTSVVLLDSLSRADRQLMVEAAASGGDATVLAYAAAGFDCGALDGMGATALHHAAIHGRLSAVRALLAAGSDIAIRDREHHSTPLGWALFGADHVADADGDYPGTVRELLRVGARPTVGEYLPEHEAVRAVLAEFP
jgi:ankyrin repeat protein